MASHHQQSEEVVANRIKEVIHLPVTPRELMTLLASLNLAAVCRNYGMIENAELLPEAVETVSVLLSVMGEDGWKNLSNRMMKLGDATSLENS